MEALLVALGELQAIHLGPVTEAQVTRGKRAITACLPVLPRGEAADCNEVSPQPLPG